MDLLPRPGFAARAPGGAALVAVAPVLCAGVTARNLRTASPRCR